MENDLEPELKELRDTFNTGKTKEYSWRISQLHGLLHILEDHEKDIFLALKTDLGKHHVEAYRDEVRNFMHTLFITNMATYRLFYGFISLCKL